MIRYIVVLYFILILFLSGCTTTSQYLLTAQYDNPDSGREEIITIPVSQYIYDTTNVGDSLDISIRTVVFGIRIPITRQTNLTMLSLLDAITPMCIAIPGIMLAYSIWCFIKKDKYRWGTIIGSLVTTSFYLYAISLQYPEFSTIGVIIDKTFQITSNGF